MKKGHQQVVELHEDQVLSYAKVKSIFGWRDNWTVRRYVSLGLLVRVKLSRSNKSHFITLSSVKSLREHLAAIADETNYQAKAHAQSMRERKGSMPQSQPEVLLDADEIIRNAYSHRGGRLPDVTTPEDSVYEAPRRSQLGFVSRRGI
jgi:hypothetical protein